MIVSPGPIYHYESSLDIAYEGRCPKIAPITEAIKKQKTKRVQMLCSINGMSNRMIGYEKKSGRRE